MVLASMCYEQLLDYSWSRSSIGIIFHVWAKRQDSLSVVMTHCTWAIILTFNDILYHFLCFLCSNYST
jgi:hypothetical protein